MYALKYGTIPVARATGGLDDTVAQWDAQTGKGNGFKFTELSADALVQAVGQAVEVYKQPKNVAEVDAQRDGLRFFVAAGGA